MNENKIKNVYRNHPINKEQIRASVLSENTAPDKSGKFRFNSKRVLAACVSLLVLVGCFSGYMMTAEAAEYKEAVEFFDEFNLSSDGLTRREIKAVYKDILMKTYSYEKTVELLNGISVEMYSTELGSADKYSLEALWNSYILREGTQDKSGVWYSVDYVNVPGQLNDNAVIIRHDGEREMWRYEIPYDMYVFIDDNILICDDGVIAYGSRDFTGAESGYACAFMLGSSGNLLWEYQSDIITSSFETAVRYKDEITLLGRRYENEYNGNGTIKNQYYYSIFTVLGTDGKVKQNTESEVSNVFFRYDTIVRIDDRYLVKQYVRTDEYNLEPELISMSADGKVTEKFSYSEGENSYLIQDIVHYNGKVYLSALLPKISETEFTKRFNDMSREFYDAWNNVGDNVKMPDDYNEKLNSLFSEAYNAVLLVCDENAVITKAYSVDNARAGKLTADSDGKLSWQVYRIDGAVNASPYISSHRVKILSTEFSFVFSENGALVEKNEIGPYTLIY